MTSLARDTTWLASHVRHIPDFPKPGIGFKDITPLLADVDAFRFAVDAIADHFDGRAVDLVLGIEARGFIVAAPVAYRLGAGFVPVRKKGKLPWKVVSRDVELEYGLDTLEMHEDGVIPDAKVLVVDDVLATGGTAAGAVELVESRGGEVVGLGFVIELVFLGGRRRMADRDLISLVQYE
jgi:adenine phosphoribosyltransferase